VQRRDIVAIGASAGAYAALSAVISRLPADFPAAVFVVMHLSPVDSGLAEIGFAKGSRLPVAAAEHGMPVRRGHVYVAPRDRHLLVVRDRMVLSAGPRENRSRPAIDPLFRSLAVAYGTRVIGVVMTGYLDDGAAGLVAIRRCGGVAVVQDPSDAQFPDMPNAALAAGHIDHVASLKEMAPLLERLAQEEAPDPPPVPEDIRLEAHIAAETAAGIDLPRQLGELSVYTCPECSGALWRITDGGLERYRCHSGHALSLEALAVGQTAELERALGMSLRVLDERIALTRRLRDQAHQRGQSRVARSYEGHLDEYRAQADLIRRVLLDQQQAEEVAVGSRAVPDP
jgi:two-component system chemotaxis response regulator CheB